MVSRTLLPFFWEMAKKFPAIVLLGPRQSGKTTLARLAFPQKPYVLLEEPDTREFAEKDPRGFLQSYPEGAILDEIQRVPHLFSYLQGILDQSKTNGLFILTGSHNFLMMEQVTQSLAGRVALLTLLPFSHQELRSAHLDFEDYETHLRFGGYPRVFSSQIAPEDFYSNYVRTYIDRDIRLLKNVQDLSTFHTFLKFCANRIGQPVNLSSIADDCGITHNTVKAWLSILEASYILFTVRPYHNNLNKRLIKTPKIYFYDTGLVCYLMGIDSQDLLTYHPMKGSLFENFIVSEVAKSFYHTGHEATLYFWQDKSAKKIDLILEAHGKVTPIELKAGKTITEDYFKNIAYWCQLTGASPSEAKVVYGGKQSQRRSTGHALGWQEFLTSL